MPRKTKKDKRGRPKRDNTFIETPVTLYQAELVSGIDSGTIVRRCKREGIKLKGGITLSDLFRVAVSAKDVAMEAKLNAETRRIDREEAEAKGQLCQQEEVKEKLIEWLRDFRKDLENDYKQQGRLEVLDKLFHKHHIKK